MATTQLPIETFPALAAIAVIRHGFVGRASGIDVRSDKAEALRRLDLVHRDAREHLGIGHFPLATAEQVHGNNVTVIDEPLTADRQFPACDGLVTDQAGVALGIHVADCGAIYFVDPERRVIALSHSGRKGTEQDIAGVTIERMQSRYGCSPRDMVVQLGPCIRPPRYEVDFAAEIVAQCRKRGVLSVHDCGTCTASDLERYYSYRAEKGRTGRMLALLALR